MTTLEPKRCELQTRYWVHITLLAHLRENSKPNSGFVLGNTKTEENSCFYSGFSDKDLKINWPQVLSTKPLSLLPSTQLIALLGHPKVGCHQPHLASHLHAPGKAKIPEVTPMPTASACLLSPSLVHVNCGSPSMLLSFLRSLPMRKVTCLLLLLPLPLPSPHWASRAAGLIPLSSLSLWCQDLCLDEHFSWKSQL